MLRRQKQINYRKINVKVKSLSKKRFLKLVTILIRIFTYQIYWNSNPRLSSTNIYFVCYFISALQCDSFATSIQVFELPFVSCVGRSPFVNNFSICHRLGEELLHFDDRRYLRWPVGKGGERYFLTATYTYLFWIIFICFYLYDYNLFYLPIIYSISMWK